MEVRIVYVEVNHCRHRSAGISSYGVVSIEFLTETEIPDGVCVMGRVRTNHVTTRMFMMGGGVGHFAVSLSVQSMQSP